MGVRNVGYIDCVVLQRSLACESVAVSSRCVYYFCKSMTETIVIIY